MNDDAKLQRPVFFDNRGIPYLSMKDSLFYTLNKAFVTN
jgi:hypothetical protein